MPPLIVIAEDDTPIRTLLAELLSDAGYRVLSAEDGAAALALVEGARPALLLTDNMMPRLSGQELIDRVRRGPLDRDLPIILTSAAPPGAVAPPTVFLPKPFDLDALVAAVERLVPPGSG